MSLFGTRRDDESDGDRNRPEAGATASHGRGPSADPARGDHVASMGKSIVFKGDLSGDEDLRIEGQLEGGVQLPDHELTIGESGRVQAQLFARSIVVVGHVTGNLTATERIEIQPTGVVEGDVHAPRLVIADGAVLNGRIEMSQPKAPPVPRPEADAG